MFNTDTYGSWHLFDLFGHPVYVSPFFLMLIALFAFMGVSAEQGGAGQIVENLLVWGPTLFLGILLHEIGHATALKHFGYGSSDIMLHGFGGVTINRRRSNAAPGRSIIISLAGPFASFALAAISLGIYILIGGSLAEQSGLLGAGSGLLLRLLWTMGLINAFWAIFNLLPINPLDGGHVVLHALRGQLGSDRKAMRYTAITSLVALGLVILGAGLFGFFDPILFPLLALMFGYQNWQMLQQTNNRGRRGPRGPMGM